MMMLMVMGECLSADMVKSLENFSLVIRKRDIFCDKFLIYLNEYIANIAIDIRCLCIDAYLLEPNLDSPLVPRLVITKYFQGFTQIIGYSKKIFS